MNNSISSALKKQNQKNGPVLSFYERLADVRESVGFDYICEADKPLAHECCLIICEVLMRPRGEIMIDGELCDAGSVAAVFASLNYEHIQHVCDRFNLISHEVKRKKQYLRTALYNAFFELEASAINDAAVGLL